MISIAVVDNQNDYRNQLVNQINQHSGYTCTGAFSTAEDALQQLPLLKPYVALVDIGLPQKSGIELIACLNTVLPNTLCMMCTECDDPQKVIASLRAGAYGYLLKSTPPAGILEAIEQLVNGGSPISAAIARKVICTIQSPVRHAAIAQLTRREKQILEQLSKGLLYKEIAMKFLISIDTVKRHCFNIYEKLRVNNRTEALNIYHQH